MWVCACIYRYISLSLYLFIRIYCARHLCGRQRVCRDDGSLAKYICIYMCVCACVYIYESISISIYTYILPAPSLRPPAGWSRRGHICIYAYMHIYIYIFIYIYIYIYICIYISLYLSIHIYCARLICGRQRVGCDEYIYIYIHIHIHDIYQAISISLYTYILPAQPLRPPAGWSRRGKPRQIYMYICVCVRVYIYIYISLSIYLYIQYTARPTSAAASGLVATRKAKRHLARLQLGLYKILLYFKAFVHETIILLLLPPTCTARTNAVLVNVYCSIYDAPPDPPFVCHTPYNIISCKEQPAAPGPAQRSGRRDRG